MGTKKTPDDDMARKLDQLSSQKKHLLTDEVKYAAAKQDQNTLLDDVLDDDDVFEDLLKQTKILKKILSRLHLDELILLLAQPFRLYPVNMLLGFTKGLGFGLGLLFIWMCYQYFLV